MDYSVLICDDRDEDARYVEEQVLTWAKRHSVTVQTARFSSAEALLFHLEENPRCDMLLLDIEMPGMDGVTLAKRVRQESETVQIVFITGYSDYIAEGYEVAALHYLMKPVKPDKLFSVLDRAANKLKRDERALVLDTGGEIFRVPIYQIRYAEVRLNYVTIHAKRDVTVKMTLSELMNQLDDRFYRVGRSHVVNLAWIGHVTRTDIFLQDGSSIRLPRGAYDGVNRAMMNMR